MSQGLREVRFPDIRQTLDRLAVVRTASTSICRRAIWGLVGDEGPADGRTRRYSVASRIRKITWSDRMRDRALAALQGLTADGCVSGADCR